MSKSQRLLEIGSAFTALCLFAPLVMIGWHSWWFVPDGETAGTLSWHYYVSLWDEDELWDGLQESGLIAVVSGFVATGLALLAGLGTVKRKGFLARLTEFLLILPLGFPELVLGISSLIWFACWKFPLGFYSVAISHVSLTLSYAYVIVKLGLERIPESLREASFDLGAKSAQYVRYVLLPEMWPTLLVSWILCAIISFDDFMVTYFTAGAGQETLPLKLYALAKFGIKGELYALSCLLVAGTVLLFGSVYAVMSWRQLRAGREQGESPK